MGDRLPAPLPRRFYDRDTAAVAKDLLGKVLRVVHGSLHQSGIIVEDEAYVSNDPANHAYRGPNARNRSMFREPGTVYVYSIHGVFCLNIVTRPAEAVLIRALQPLHDVVLPTDGPGRLCRALGITRREHDGITAFGSAIRVRDHSFPPFEIGVSPRIGVSRARDLPLRFYVKDNPFVSR